VKILKTGNIAKIQVLLGKCPLWAAIYSAYENEFLNEKHTLRCKTKQNNAVILIAL